MSAARQHLQAIRRVDSDFMWGYDISLLVAVPAEVLAPEGAMALIRRHSGSQELTELGAGWVLVTPPDGGPEYYWHRPSSATQFECPWCPQMVSIEPSSMETVSQLFDAIGAHIGAEIPASWEIVFAGAALPENDLLSKHFPERYDDGNDGSASNATFFCHMEDVEASRRAAMETNLQLIRVVSRFKALGKQTRESMVSSIAVHRTARTRAVTQTELLCACEDTLDAELAEVESKIAALEAAGAAQTPRPAALEAVLEPSSAEQPEPEPEPGPEPEPEPGPEVQTQREASASLAARGRATREAAR